MRLAFKFFAIAYAIVLLSTGIGGMVLIRHMTDTLWNTRVQTVKNAEIYALDSFSAFAETIPGIMTTAQQNRIEQQIKTSVDSAIRTVEVTRTDAYRSSQETYADNEGRYAFTEENGELLMTATCRVNTGTDAYIVRVTADFTEQQRQCRALWQGYAVTVLCLSAVSGLLIFLLTKSVTRPLARLAASAQRIAAGEYGETVQVGSRDKEIVELSESFNGMSVTIAQKIEAITEEAEKRERFVADFAHEMKTPMTAIIGYAQMLFQYELSEDERAEAARAIYKEGKRLEKLSLQMLDWSVYRQEEANRVPLSLETVATSLRATLSMLSAKYQRPFTLRFGAETVFADEVLILSLLYNLADNAFKASDERGIELCSEPCEEGVVLYVRDFGGGIAPENIRKLTEPFYREDKSRSRAFGGAGLGLAICKRIAVLHETALHFDSVPGQGTTVSVVLKKGGEAS